jgi:hypothetical protein
MRLQTPADIIERLRSQHAVAHGLTYIHMARGLIFNPGHPHSSLSMTYLAAYKTVKRREISDALYEEMYP